MITDDSTSARELVESYLRDFGDCDLVPDGREAVKLFEMAMREGRPFDLIIMDIMMPVMDGLTASKKIVELMEQREIPENERARIITLSGAGDPEYMMDAHFESGADVYITKPFEKNVLYEAIAGLGFDIPHCPKNCGCFSV
jgi:two-component system chemotaxis response regulator CheY